ncbi:class I SAM-dependent methyltransferase [Rhodoblastus sp.]|uniref:class I SAM-dependent methyltransferase n=1 Tax=Rhodoblastus sp. TaxID=1962975 RepID=UPI0025F8B5FA|nr:class I SAM-dependent methyltransferase [Rhodoblastus sp.]
MRVSFIRVLTLVALWTTAAVCSNVNIEIGAFSVYTVSSPRITYSSEFRNSANPFRDKFGGIADDNWKDVWLTTETCSNIQGIEFPTIPEQQLQSQIHGSSSWQISMGEAFAFYEFVKSSGALDGAKCFLDFGCGWGRMTRPFMRDFDLGKIYGFEPNALHAIIARSLNPYFTVFTGGFSPDGSIPKDWFDLVVGWSIFSHLSEKSLKEWLTEICSVLRPGGHAVFTTWGIRFLKRLQGEQALLDAGQEIHWYSKQCLDGVGNISKRIADYENGDFIWFTNTDSTEYGEAFLGEKALNRFVSELDLPMEVTTFDATSLAQDVFILRKRQW